MAEVILDAEYLKIVRILGRCDRCTASGKCISILTPVHGDNPLTAVKPAFLCLHCFGMVARYVASRTELGPIAT